MVSSKIDSNSLYLYEQANLLMDEFCPLCKVECKKVTRQIAYLIDGYIIFKEKKPEDFLTKEGIRTVSEYIEKSKKKVLNE